MVRRVVLSGALAWGLVACGPATDVEVPEVGAPATEAEAPAQTASIAGTYEMDGMTVEKKSGAKRKISGTIVVSQEGTQYSASLHLTTTYPTPDGPLPADVIGDAEGTIAGSKLKGTARTQLVMATVPGVDPKFAFVPRWVGPRLVSSAVGELGADGTLTLHTENEPAEGEEYAATRTTLRGPRVSGDVHPPKPPE